jgi:hypothetical protein
MHGGHLPLCVVALEPSRSSSATPPPPPVQRMYLLPPRPVALELSRRSPASPPPPPVRRSCHLPPRAAASSACTEPCRLPLHAASPEPSRSSLPPAASSTRLPLKDSPQGCHCGILHCTAESGRQTASVHSNQILHEAAFLRKWLPMKAC